MSYTETTSNQEPQPETSANVAPSKTIDGFYHNMPVWVVRSNKIVASRVENVKATFDKTTVKVEGLPKAVDAEQVFPSEEAAREAFFNSRIKVIE